MPRAEQNSQPRGLLLLVMGAKGAVGSTVAAAVAAMGRNPAQVLPWLTTGHRLQGLGPAGPVGFAGWDSRQGNLQEALRHHGVIPEPLWMPHEEELGGMRVLPAPEGPLREQVEILRRQLDWLLKEHPGASPVMVDLLPACPASPWPRCESLEELLALEEAPVPPDLAYAVAAVRSGVPFVNFTSNHVEHPLLVGEAASAGVPMCGRDGKTGQTFFKVVLASALRARNLRVDGWYSLNILGNEDGKNLSDPSRASSKLANKTRVLEDVLGYPVEGPQGEACHGVHIAYYPPRGDAKEAWDVIDFSGIFGLPMSLRLNLMARDSVLAAPLVVDLARWMAGLKKAGRSGLIPELGFYFKKPLGEGAPRTFEEQLQALRILQEQCSGTGGLP